MKAGGRSTNLKTEDSPMIARILLALGVDASIWQGLMAPGRTPPAIINRLNKEGVTQLAIAKVRDQFKA